LGSAAGLRSAFGFAAAFVPLLCLVLFFVLFFIVALLVPAAPCGPGTRSTYSHMSPWVWPESKAIRPEFGDFLAVLGAAAWRAA